MPSGVVVSAKSKMEKVYQNNKSSALKKEDQLEIEAVAGGSLLVCDPANGIATEWREEREEREREGGRVDSFV